MSKVLWVPKFRIFKIVQIFGEIVTNPTPHTPAHQSSRPPPEYVNAASSQLVLHRQNVDIMIQLYSNLVELLPPALLFHPSVLIRLFRLSDGGPGKVSPCAAYSFRPPSTHSSTLVPHLFIYRHSSPLVVAFNCPALPGQQNRIAKKQQSRTRRGAAGGGA